MNTPARQPYIQTASNNNNDDDLTIVIIIIINNNNSSNNFSNSQKQQKYFARFLINTHIFVQTFAMELSRNQTKTKQNKAK